jgi:hypothetical protein
MCIYYFVLTYALNDLVIHITSPPYSVYLIIIDDPLFGEVDYPQNLKVWIILAERGILMDIVKSSGLLSKALCPKGAAKLKEVAHLNIVYRIKLGLLQLSVAWNSALPVCG